jgi:hypothetical protein
MFSDPPFLLLIEMVLKRCFVLFFLVTTFVEAFFDVEVPAPLWGLDSDELAKVDEFPPPFEGTRFENPLQILRRAAMDLDVAQRLWLRYPVKDFATQHSFGFQVDSGTLQDLDKLLSGMHLIVSSFDDDEIGEKYFSKLGKIQGKSFFDSSKAGKYIACVARLFNKESPELTVDELNSVWPASRRSLYEDAARKALPRYRGTNAVQVAGIVVGVIILVILVVIFSRRRSKHRLAAAVHAPARASPPPRVPAMQPTPNAAPRPQSMPVQSQGFQQPVSMQSTPAVAIPSAAPMQQFVPPPAYANTPMYSAPVVPSAPAGGYCYQVEGEEPGATC